MPTVDEAKPTMPVEPTQVAEVPTDRQIMTARFEPGGRLLVTAGYDGLVRRWDFTGEEPRELEPLAGHHGWIERITFLGDDRLVSADSWGRLRCWSFDPADPAGEWTVAWDHEQAHDGWIRGLDVTPDGTRVVTGGNDRAARVRNAADGKLVRELPNHHEEVHAVALHPDGENVVTADLRGVVVHWSVATGERVRAKIETGLYFEDKSWASPGIRFARFEDDGRTLVVAGSERTATNRTVGHPAVQFYDWATAERTRSLRCSEDVSQGYVFDLAFRDARQLVVVTSGQPGKGQLLVFDLDSLDAEEEESAKPVFQHTKMANCHALAPHPDGRRFVVAATNKRSQGNGAVTDKEGRYLGNSSPLHVWEWPQTP